MIEIKSTIDLNGVIAALQDALPKASKAMADVIHKEADERVPIVSGDLRRSGRVKRVLLPTEPDVTAHAVRFGDRDAPYASIVHFSEDGRGRQFLRDAAMQTAREAKAAAADVLERAMQRANRAPPKRKSRGGSGV